MAKKIRIVINEDMEIHRDFEGFVGDECFREAEAIDREMEEVGIVIKERKIKKKPDTAKQVVSVGGH